MGSPRSTAALRLLKPSSAEPTEDRVPPPASALDDAELLAALRRGDPTAASSLYARARPQVDRTILAMLRREDRDHEDLVQIAMIGLVGSVDRFRAECSLDTWIARITARTVWKELRKRKSTGRMLDAASAVESVRMQHVSDPERDAGDRDVLARIQRHLDAMDPLKAWTVVLHDVCGYDLAEIAEITEASMPAAQSRLGRGRAELHARIAKDPDLANALEQRRGRK